MVRFIYPGGYRSRIPGLSWLGLYIQEDTGVGYLVYHGKVCISRRIEE